jgi:hypothetical protein
MDHRPPPHREFPGFDKDDRITFRPMESGPGFDLLGDRETIPIIFGPKEFIFEVGNENVSHSISEDPWNITMDLMNRTLRYNTEISANGFGPFDLSFMMRPSDDGTRKVHYNLSMEGDLDIDRVKMKWGFDFDRDNISMKMKERFKWWREKETLNLNYTDDRTIMKINMYKHARYAVDDEIRTRNVELESVIEEDMNSILLTLDMEEGVKLLETSGYLEFLEDVLGLLGETGEATVSFIRDHWISLSIGVASIIVISSALLFYSIGREVQPLPERELDYRSSRSYIGPRKRQGQ